VVDGFVVVVGVVAGGCDVVGVPTVGWVVVVDDGFVVVVGGGLVVVGA
jgi:hypothetical protein